MLRLQKDILVELTSDELAAVAAAGPQTDNEQCVSGIIQCTADRVKEALSLKAC